MVVTISDSYLSGPLRTNGTMEQPEIIMPTQILSFGEEMKVLGSVMYHRRVSLIRRWWIPEWKSRV